MPFNLQVDVSEKNFVNFMRNIFTDVEEEEWDSNSCCYGGKEWDRGQWCSQSPVVIGGDCVRWATTATTNVVNKRGGNCAERKMVWAGNCLCLGGLNYIPFID